MKPTASTRQMIQIAAPVLGDKEWEAVREPIVKGWVTQGIQVANFEKQFAISHKVNYAIAVTSCTTALHLALLSFNIGPGDEVIVPAFTWIASANAVLYCGAKPVFVDIDLSTYNMDTEKLAKKITSRTKAILPVHLFGLCADIDRIKNIAPGIPLVEDAACAAGSEYKGKPAGGLGDIGCFSFHPRKIITTGEGGMVTTNNPKIAEMVQMLRNHGAALSEEKRHDSSAPFLLPEFTVLGFNYRMTDLQGAIGCVQLEQLDRFIKERQLWASYYQQHLDKIEWLKIPVVEKQYKHSWQSFVCLVDESKAPYPRNTLMQILFEKGISTRPGTHAVHTLDLYKKKYGFKKNDCPNAYIAQEYSLSLPLHNRMKREDFEYVIETIKSIR